MCKVIEAAIHTLKSIIDNEPKEPLHVGEVMSCWLYLAFSPLDNIKKSLRNDNSRIMCTLRNGGICRK
jgi:hypothetical protein